MRPIVRDLSQRIREAAQSFPAIVLTGPRRAGKTTLLHRLYAGATYVLLEDPDIQTRVRTDPRGLIDSLRPPVVFDEIQNVPEILPYIRTRIDQHPRKMGQWIFTGSQEAPLMQGVTESMAGRAAILQLLPLSLHETPRVSPLLGGFPEVLARPQARTLWFSSYIQTYLERDVRSIVNIRDLAAFRRFLALLASRHGQVLNKTDLAAPLGVSVPTITEWLHVLEITGQVILTPPYFENFGKRLIKSPKLYIGDSGMACYLLGIQTQAELDRSPFLGPIYEGFIASEILKSQINQGRRKELYHFRDRVGLEVDFLFPDAQGGLWMVECKASKTVLPGMAAPIEALTRGVTAKSAVKTPVRKCVVHRASRSTPATTALAPGIAALTTEQFIAELVKPRGRRSSARSSGGIRRS